MKLGLQFCLKFLLLVKFALIAAIDSVIKTSIASNIIKTCFNLTFQYCLFKQIIFFSFFEAASAREARQKLRTHILPYIKMLRSELFSNDLFLFEACLPDLLKQENIQIDCQSILFQFIFLSSSLFFFNAITM